MARTRQSKRSGARTNKKYGASDSNTLFAAGIKKKQTNKMNQIGTKEKPINKAQLLSTLGINNMTVGQYIPSEIDRSDLVDVQEVDILKKHGGKGLFAKSVIRKGTCIGEYTGKIFDSLRAYQKHIEAHDKADNSYAMKIKGKIIDASIKGNYTRYINFSDSQDNVYFVQSMLKGKPIVRVIARREILPGEQFLVNYNEYDEEMSAHYFFLNPEDNAKSAAEVLQEHEADYACMELYIDVAPLQVKKGDLYYMTAIGQSIINSRQLKPPLDPALVNLPFLKADEHHTPFDFDEADAFTPLMLACYAGHALNVAYLIEYGADVNQRQHHSGNCPLFLALQGYEGSHSIHKGEACLQIFEALIKNGANICVHDREDRTFLHLALHILPPELFRSVIALVAAKKDITQRELFTYLDKEDNDIVLSCIKHKKIEHLTALLSLYPKYFQKNYDTARQEFNRVNIAGFREAIKLYNEIELRQLYVALTDEAYLISPDLFRELGIENPDDYSDDLAMRLD